ncbi:MAG: DMT family transporter [Spirochaetaceae bacterium]|nr:DMT family transporter [Spirochaetaceae bacterium]
MLSFPHSERKKAYAAMILCVLFWGFSFISIKIAVSVLPPMTLGAIRFAIGIAVLFVYKLIADSKTKKAAEISRPVERLQRADIPLLSGAALTGISIYFYFENNGVKLIGAGEASIITGAIPVLCMIAESIFLKSRIGGRQWTGAAISISGVALVSGVSLSLSGDPLGYIYMACCAVLWVVYCFLTRPLFERRSRIYIVFWQTLFGFLGFLPFLIFEAPIFDSLTPFVFAHIVFLGVFCSAIGYMFYVYALTILGVSISALFINIIPAVSVIAAFFLLDERLTLLQWIGAAFTIAGVYLASMSSKGEG